VLLENSSERKKERKVRKTQTREVHIQEELIRNAKSN